MNLEAYIRILKNHVDFCALNFGDGESVFTLLYEAYAGCNKMHDERTLGAILSTDYHGKVKICWNAMLG